MIISADIGIEFLASRLINNEILVIDNLISALISYFQPS